MTSQVWLIGVDINVTIVGIVKFAELKEKYLWRWNPNQLM